MLEVGQSSITRPFNSSLELVFVLMAKLNKKVCTVPDYQPVINRSYQAYDSANIYDMSYCLVIVALVILIFLRTFKDYLVC